MNFNTKINEKKKIPKWARDEPTFIKMINIIEIISDIIV